MFANIEKHIAQLGILFEASTGMDENRESNVDIATKNNNGEPLGFFRWAWESVGDAWDKVETGIEATGSIWSLFMVTLNLGLVLAGLLIMGIAAFTPIILNKIFFMLGLGFAPLFIMFLAFDSTKGWFNSWLNSTLGYCLSYPLAMMVVSVLLSIYSQLYNQDTLNYINGLTCFVTSLIFSVIIARIGDVASSWFSAQNISDGTAAAAAIFMSRTISRGGQAAKFSGKSIGKGGAATAKVSWGLSKGTYRLGKLLANKGNRTGISEGDRK